MSYVIRVVLILVLSGCVIPVASAVDDDAQVDEAPLTLGILPFQSAVTLFKRFAPLREYLSQRIGREIELATAPDYTSFVQRTDRGLYDIVLTAPHFTLLASNSGHYEVFSTLDKPLSAVVVVAQDSPITDIAELTGKLISTPPETAIIGELGARHLRDLGVDARYKPYASHNAGHQAALGGDTDAAIISVYVYQGELKKGVASRLLSQSREIPAMGLLMRADLPLRLKTRIADSFNGMLSDAEGAQIIRLISYPGFKPATLQDFDSLWEFLPNRDEDSP